MAIAMFIPKLEVLMEVHTGPNFNSQHWIHTYYISTIVFHFRHILFLHDLLIHLFFPYIYYIYMYICSVNYIIILYIVHFSWVCVSNLWPEKCRRAPMFLFLWLIMKVYNYNIPLYIWYIRDMKRNSTTTEEVSRFQCLFLNPNCLVWKGILPKICSNTHGWITSWWRFFHQWSN